MSLPAMVSDETLEYAAQLIERGSFADLMGTAAARKRDREDAALRARSRKEMRSELAALIRAMIARPELSPIGVLRRLSEMPERQVVLHLMEAWPLAWRGWIDITATIKCNSNSAPPEVEYRISLTDAGREALADERRAA